MRIVGISASILVALMVFGIVAQAEPPALTTIVIEDLDCPSCAKKVAAKLKAVPGVAKVECDVEKTIAVVTAQAGKAPSPRALWDAVEQAGFRPTKLTGPSGTFVAKPQS